MKRETMEWLREGATWPKRLGRVPKESQRFMEVEAELKRLRRKAKEATNTDLAVWWDGFNSGREFEVVDEHKAERHAKSRIAALKKGGRK